ncbi:hypothetical protein AN2377.2 [Aspergillus nidulans FGSC A4]|uniref:C2H2-type domain-containing protein n=1 Tax=Emericella nidulans (strain FGSC A4 / ATCC 38163 / CBS 112.46 / NRRL 194 / M139) TaxID=227321 RepID=Q5BAQ3_EMENI|nr:hypothetical protein [Aspergillus nidulans FGSC A4]EAA64488.1 hypothetical protein AN2377.2 [Aspergillus nidulans FGSC A4]CBF86722.1 TPA: conserved hypothetical protein [Aspergillus nidulans FGSC A4]|eukprot:XP_659981.1 hypothetical protein AN2377.2 [Aspergillus nidulans FGSC A4]
MNTNHLRRFLNEAQRFDIWASNLGVFHDGHSSLDYRFRDSSPLFEYTSNLLYDLSEALSAFALQVAPGPHSQEAIVDDFDDLTLSDDESEDFSSYQEGSLPDQYLTNISTTVNRLYALSFRVRNPKMRTGLSKALSYKEVDSETGVDLMEAYMERDSRRLEELFRTWRVGDEAGPQFMVERLARANMNRRKQFRYWERRKIKYQYYHNVATGCRWLRELETTSIQRNTRPSEPSTATSPNTSVILETESTVSTDTFVVTSGGTFDPLELPAPPVVDADSPEFECPYCFTICAEETARPHAWRRHILRDLRPYICTFKNCKDADQQYDTFTDWASHESSSHGIQPTATRTCPICTRADSTAHHIASHLRHIACFVFSGNTKATNTDQDAAGHSNSANIGSIDWDSGSEDSDFDDEWAAHTKTIHLDLTACGFGVTRIQLRPEDVVETTVFKYTDPNGHPIPLDYDSLYNDIIVHVDFVRDATISGTPATVDMLGVWIPCEPSITQCSHLEPQDNRARDDPVPPQPAIFAILWHESPSYGSAARSSVLERGPQYIGRFGEPIYSTIRRMVVFRKIEQVSWCFAITTYGGRGLKKSGLNPSQHVVLYERGTTPIIRTDEPPMTMGPLPVVLAAETGRLDSMSRLNFGKIYTVEHNACSSPDILFFWGAEQRNIVAGLCNPQTLKFTLS